MLFRCVHDFEIPYLHVELFVFYQIQLQQLNFGYICSTAPARTGNLMLLIQTSTIDSLKIGRTRSTSVWNQVEITKSQHRTRHAFS